MTQASSSIGVADDPLSASLLWLAQQHGVSLTRDALTSGLPLQQGRLLPSVLPRAAARLGMSAQAVQQPLARLNRALLPCILVLADQRACIVLDADADLATLRLLMMPEAVELQLPRAELEAQYSGMAFYCRPRFVLDERANPVPGSQAAQGHWFWQVIRQNRGLYRDVLVAALVINLFALSMPLFTMNVYDRVVPNMAIDTLWVLGLGVFIIITGDLILRLLRSWFVDVAANRADLQLSAQIMERLLGQRLEAKPASVGSFASNVQSFESVRSFMGSMSVSALIDLPFFVLFVVIIGVLAWPMAIPVVVGAALVIGYALAVEARMRQMADLVSQASSQRNASLIENLTAAETLRSFNATSRAQSVWERATEFVSGCAAQLRLLGASVGSVAMWTQQTVSVVLMIIGVYLVIDGNLSQGGLIAAYMLSSRAMAPISQTAALLTQYHSAAMAMQSLESLMASPQERAPGTSQVSHPRLRGEIELRDVGFSYPNEQRPALQGINLRIKAGERVAIVGRAGSGKSTLEKLIMGLYQPSAGQVLIDGLHQGQIDIAELRRNIGYVPQEIQLLHGSVYDNIILGVPDASREQLLAAVNDAGLAALVGERAEGLGLPVGENGGRLSGGQRQTVALARALIEDRPILLLDEPTSALDSTLENHVVQSLARCSVGKTLLLITHRNSLLDLVDRLVVMDQGRIVADGPKVEVLKALAGGSLRKVSP
ncbi:type I secretion system permease/ATPase [Sinimarinibacterium sp. NLF-5-8]|uniref:type I secretion system permease/ATPase n=1 Tax=Sinimarinibacterium sp. NLF-5-8 TaxID=2698684 RepID=UPI00137BC27B|nr:type I secretion system permease/ATPase [Sinimarinibacterium sp. NLF-5-8]QHS10152.1 type I secretion system permease/ATPase [Sinimarinibacterium sp. NLF-5-8]